MSHEPRFPIAGSPPEQVAHGVMTARLIARDKWLVSGFRNETPGFECPGSFRKQVTRSAAPNRSTLRSFVRVPGAGSLIDTRR